MMRMTFCHGEGDSYSDGEEGLFGEANSHGAIRKRNHSSFVRVVNLDPEEEKTNAVFSNRGQNNNINIEARN